jgi:membrane-bound ClpP family serine protease
MLTSLVMVQRVARLGRRKKSLCGETLIGEIGEAQTGLGPDGVVTIRRRSYPASAATSIAAGERVRVIGTGKILAVERYTR